MPDFDDDGSTMDSMASDSTMTDAFSPDQASQTPTGANQPPPDPYDQIKRLGDAQTSVLTNPSYTPRNKTGISYCNQATYDVARRMGVNLAPFESKSGTAALANVQTKQLEMRLQTRAPAGERSARPRLKAMPIGARWS